MKERQSTRRRLSLRSACGVIAAVLSTLAAAELAAQPWAGQSTLGVQIRGKGGPVEGAVVEIRQRRPGSVIGPNSLGTDSRGQANFVNISAGRWSLEIKHPDYLSFVAAINVKRGKKPEIVTQFLEASGPGRGTFRVKFLSSTQWFGEVIPGTALGKASSRPAPVQQRLPRTVPIEEPEEPTQPTRESRAPDPPAIPEIEPYSLPTVAEVLEPLDDPLEKPWVESPMPAEAAQSPDEPSITAPPPTAAATGDPSEPVLEPGTPPVTVPDPPERGSAVEPPVVTAVAEPVLKPVATAPVPPIEPTVEPAAEPTVEPVEAQAIEPEASSQAPIPIEVPAPELPEPDPEPVAKPELTTPPPALRPPPAPAPDSLRAYRDRSCFECKPGEWAVSSQIEVQSGDACRSTAEVAVRRAMRDVAAAASEQLGTFAGPLLLDFEAQPWALSSAARNTLAPYLDNSTSCRFLAVVVPLGARFTGFRFEAGDANATGDCSGEQECDIGQARFVFSPVTARGTGASIVYSLFENTGGSPRSARMSGFFLPAGGWSPE